MEQFTTPGFGIQGDFNPALWYTALMPAMGGNNSEERLNTFFVAAGIAGIHFKFELSRKPTKTQLRIQTNCHAHNKYMTTLTAARLPITTERLLLEPLSTSDSNFILELVNTEGWLKFIGDRNVHSTADATAYIEKIVNNPAFAYWTVKPRDTPQSIGIITFIKRDYLPHHDVGFAFLPASASQGYAREAARAVLAHLKNHQAFETILATTLPDNKTSIKLLEKLGLKFDKDMEVDGSKRLHVYAAEAGDLI